MKTCAALLLTLALCGCGASMTPAEQAACLASCQSCVECVLEVAQPPVDEPVDAHDERASEAIPGDAE